MDMIIEKAAVKLGEDMRTWIENCAAKVKAESDVSKQNFGLVKITDAIKAKLQTAIMDNPRLTVAIEKLSALSPEVEAGIAERVANLAEYLVGDDAQRDGRRAILGWNISNKDMLAQLRAAGFTPKADANKKVTVGDEVIKPTVELEDF